MVLRRGVGLGIAALPGAATAAMQEQIGSWVLHCPGDKAGSEPCVMRLDRRFLDKGGITGDLEVQARDGTLVPVLALRGLSGEMLAAASMAGTAKAWLQFPGGAPQELACAAAPAAYLCTPDAATGKTLAGGLATARAITVRVSVSLTGMSALPAQDKTLELSRTGEALARLRSVGPTQVPGPLTVLAGQAPAGLIGMADKALKAAGYPNGIADLRAMLGKYMQK